jgi:hypothetical protein
MLDKLLGNPLVKKMVLGKLQEAFTENDLTLIELKLNDKGEVDAVLHKEPMKVIKQSEYDEMIKSLKSIL